VIRSDINKELNKFEKEIEDMNVSSVKKQSKLESSIEVKEPNKPAKIKKPLVKKKLRKIVKKEQSVKDTKASEMKDPDEAPKKIISSQLRLSGRK